MKKFMLVATIFLVLGCMNNMYGQDWPNLTKYALDNEQLDMPKQGEHRIVFMGNSITEGWSNLMPEFFEGNAYINRGIGGQTTPQMLIRFRQDVVDLQPEVVVILAGINDIAGNTGPSTIKMIADNLKSMAEIAHANQIKVVLCSVLPAYDFPWRPGLEPAGKVIELNSILKSYADEKGHMYLDYFSEMVDDKNGLIESYGTDGVHPNEMGYAIMAKKANAIISEALKD